MKILLVEDDRSWYEDLLLVLPGELELSWAADSRQALRWLAGEASFDVIVLDMEVDEALKMIISLGVVVPRWRKDQIGELPLEPPPQP